MAGSSKKKSKESFPFGTKIKVRRLWRSNLFSWSVMINLTLTYFLIFWVFSIPDPLWRYFRIDIFHENNILVKYFPYSGFVGFGLSFLFMFLSKKVLGGYLPCPNPNCNKSVELYEDWKCDYCHNKQGHDRFITAECSQCKRKLEKVFCEHCDAKLVL